MRRSLLILALLAACKKAETPAAGASAPAPGTPAWKIADAHSAAPPQIAAGAAVRDGSPFDTVPGAELAAGQNGWTCFPDDPGTPADDPICLDEQALAFSQAWARKQPPHLTGMAVAYMLKGGQSASDTDPFKMAPDSGRTWLADPPQIAIAMPAPRSYAGLPTQRRPDGPWVRFTGTPYAYIVVPAEGR